MRPPAFLLAILLTGFPALPLCAQHTGAGSRGGGAMHFGANAPARSGIPFGLSPRVPSHTFGSLPHSAYPAAGLSALRPVTPRRMRPFSGNGGYHSPASNRDPHRHPWGGGYPSTSIFAYGVYPLPNLVGYPFGFALPETGDTDGAYSDDREEQENTGQSPTDEESAELATEQEDVGPAPPPPDSQNAETDSGISYRPPYQGPISSEQVHLQPATTLLFNDGRPAEVVHNYILTKTTLSSLDDGAHREIPLSEIDLPATVEANRKDGVDFSLPVAR